MGYKCGPPFSSSSPRRPTNLYEAMKALEQEVLSSRPSSPYEEQKKLESELKVRNDRLQTALLDIKRLKEKNQLLELELVKAKKEAALGIIANHDFITATEQDYMLVHHKYFESIKSRKELLERHWREKCPIFAVVAFFAGACLTAILVHTAM